MRSKRCGEVMNRRGSAKHIVLVVMIYEKRKGKQYLCLRKERSHGERCASECIGGHCGVLRSSKGAEEKMEKGERVAENTKSVRGEYI